MQWSTEPQGGFTKSASPVLPVIHQGPYAFQHVNVAQQRRDPNSLLNWTERIREAEAKLPSRSDNGAIGARSFHLVKLLVFGSCHVAWQSPTTAGRAFDYLQTAQIRLWLQCLLGLTAVAGTSPAMTGLVAKSGSSNFRRLI